MEQKAHIFLQDRTEAHSHMYLTAARTAAMDSVKNVVTYNR